MDVNMPVRLRDGSGLTVRPMSPDDHAAVVSLIDTDWLPGQHHPSRQFPLKPAKRLREAEILVVCNVHGEVAGVVDVGVRLADGAGLIVQLHGREDFEIVTALLTVARAHLGQRTLYACTGPATATGIPGLPVEHRAVTARALTAAGFSPASAQRYFLRDLTTAPPAPPECPLADVTPIADPPGWQLELTDTDGRHIATAILRAPTPETADMAVLWQLTVRHPNRRQGIATRLLSQCLRHAAQHGAHHLTADAPDGDIPAAHLLAGAGFLALDTLTVYQRRL
ncbi:GNAT family N-acetyltransferase [Streptomyces sp. NBC_01077]|uniref:GNAT family N-acetyltransferase n=1 Tax=Streptomyces sp. NBC_01077 TaxID=2903746 RepID=UPI003863466C|nr:GNAT family N-acetyltransferase [Streptomyces sp. NBC_01077]WSV43801.1 GNAT family N-acetyltransferase [Streptomyces sp. NBC_01077]